MKKIFVLCTFLLISCVNSAIADVKNVGPEVWITGQVKYGQLPIPSNYLSFIVQNQDINFTPQYFPIEPNPFNFMAEIPAASNANVLLVYPSGHWTNIYACNINFSVDKNLNATIFAFTFPGSKVKCDVSGNPNADDAVINISSNENKE